MPVAFFMSRFLCRVVCVETMPLSTQEITDPQREMRRFRWRLVLTMVLVVLAFAGLLSRFAWLQIKKYHSYHALAEENRIAVVPIPPSRGVIMDRHGEILAKNYSAYTLEVTPIRHQPLDDLIAQLSQIIAIEAKDIKRFKKNLEESKTFESIPLRSRLTDEEVARFSAHKYRFPNVEIKARLFRQYPLGETAAHVIGYIGRISKKDQDNIESFANPENYRGTQYMGKTGVEQSYEQELHGKTGFEEVEVSAGGKAIRTLSKSSAISGNNLYLSLDIQLQKIAEDLFGKRKGALVAIEPATGDILAFASMPTFDPNLFVEGIDPDSWHQLNTSPDKPLLNRALRGTYPIGSTYKPFMALAALETGKRTPYQGIADPGYFMLGTHKFRDDKVGGHGWVDMYHSIVHSCDTYYYILANDMGVDAIHKFMKPFGFGQITGIDVDGEVAGILPSSAWKLKRYRQRWLAGETISIGIGQGYNAFTILQLAHATANLANRGVVMKPHLVKLVEDAVTKQQRMTVPTESYRIPLKSNNIQVIVNALVGVNREGTARKVFKNTGYLSAGKTGTAQVIGIKQNERYDVRRIATQHRDHSLFMAFAPADKPRLALAIIVENGGFGADAAAPMARQIFDYYLLGKTPDRSRLSFANTAGNSPLLGKESSAVDTGEGAAVTDGDGSTHD
jgi:penicillin-binding protein 2